MGGFKHELNITIASKVLRIEWKIDMGRKRNKHVLSAWLFAKYQTMNFTYILLFWQTLW